MNREKDTWREESHQAGREASRDNEGAYRREGRDENQRPRFSNRGNEGNRSAGRYDRVGNSGNSDNRSDSRSGNRYDNRGGNRYESRGDNRDGNRYEGRSENRGGSRFAGRSSDSRGGNRYDNRTASSGPRRVIRIGEGGVSITKETGAPVQGGDRGRGRSFTPRDNRDRKPRFSSNRGDGEFRRPVRRDSEYDPNAKYSKRKQVEYKQLKSDPNELIRINRYLANAGVCSRREADEFVSAGAVSVNGEIITELGTKVKRSDEVKFNGELISIEKKVYVLLNKPKDCVTTMDDPRSRLTVMDLVKNACDERIYPVGRLDRRTTGVLLLTNDGDLASKLTHPSFEKKKVYHVFTDRNVTKNDIDQIAEGIELEDGMIKADSVGYTDDAKRNQVGIEIHSGRNRIVRRIFESLGYRVVRLDRVLFAGLTKKGLRRGEWRYLSGQEVGFLKMGSF